MNTNDHKELQVFCLMTAIFISSSVFANGVDELHILKISGQDERAVIKAPDGKMVIIKPGDVLRDEDKTISGPELRVVEIAKDRVVIEEKKDKETEKIIIRLENGIQRTERIKKKTEQIPQLYAPLTTTKKNDN